MDSQDILFYSLAVGFLVLVGFLSYASYRLAQSLKALTLVLQDAKDITQDVKEIKSGLKMGLLNLLGGFFKKGVRKNGK